MTMENTVKDFCVCDVKLVQQALQYCIKLFRNIPIIQIDDCDLLDATKIYLSKIEDNLKKISRPRQSRNVTAVIFRSF